MKPASTSTQRFLLLSAVIVAIGFLLFVPRDGLWAQPAAKPATVVIRMDFIIGGKHAPWFVAWEKGFYAKRGLEVKVEPGAGSADTIRAIAAGNADVGFADLSTAIVARSRGTPVMAVAQLGYVPTTILWREDTDIKTLKDLEGKSWAISPGQAQWYLMPAFCRINNVDFKAIKIQETAAASATRRLGGEKGRFYYHVSCLERRSHRGRGYQTRHQAEADFHGAVWPRHLRQLADRQRGRSQAATRDHSGLCRRHDGGAEICRDHQEEALNILLKHKPELGRDLTQVQLKNALEEVFISKESLESGFGYMKPEVMEKTVMLINEYFDVAKKVTAQEIYSNQFIKK